MKFTKSFSALFISLVIFTFSLLLMGVSCDKNPVDTDDNLVFGTMTDIDGNVYKTIKIGNQEWMAENLRVTRYNDGTAIPLVKDGAEWSNLTTPGYCYYNNDTTDKAKYGALYNWYTVNPANSKKIAPIGWHVPSDTEWDTMKNYLIKNGYNYDETTSGNKIAKSLAAKTDWSTTTTPGTIGCDYSKNNSSGFSALPGGYRWSDGTFDFQSFWGKWWSATELCEASSYTYYRYLYYNDDSLCCSIELPVFGISVRLVKNN